MRRSTFAVFAGAVVALVILSLHPIDGALVRAGWLLSLLTAFGAAFALWPRSWIVGTAAAACLVVPVAVAVMPGRSHSRAALRAKSVEVLQSFEGTPYVWGGEGRLGIDCSGLVRQGLIRASLAEGMASGDGDLLRSAASLWWHDATARALRDQHRGATRLLFEAPSINAVPVDRLEPGDFAVTSNGVHVLAYVGDGRWIQADPGAGAVVTVETPSADPWFGVPVHVMRWEALAE